MNISAKVESFTAEEAAAVVNGTALPADGHALVNISGND
jgi:hypothetical protein